MYYVRRYTAGGMDYDPRQKHWAVYHCDNCGEDVDIDITRHFETYDLSTPKKCPHCKCLDPEDHEKNLKSKIKDLTLKKNRIQIEIDQIIRELDELASKQKSVKTSK